ncbi:hypothetical protein [Croceicoccus sp. Ery15]|uniref:hypothetical protein n=1 Tax=Croceicoccus sp. Ery15 TaxID=1703338 RepID=UPI001E55399B|nr:hypothetical protein [Croceicoccus sp. Ery15]
MTMLAASILLAMAPAAAPQAQPLPEGDPITVIAGRMASVSVMVGQDEQGRWHCSMDGSSGVPALDDRLCRAVTDCVRKGAGSEADVTQCVTRSKSTLIEKFTREARRNS